MSAVPGAVLLAAAAAAALLATRTESVALIALVLLAVCLRAPRGRRLYVLGALVSGLGVFLVWPFLDVSGATVLWSGPRLPVLGPVDVTAEELAGAAHNGLRLAAVGLAFAGYALLLDHDRLLAAAAVARRSALAAALATRLVPALQRDAAGLADALRGRGVSVAGVRGHARLISPLVAGSLERALNLAEAMEARGFGRAGSTRAPRPVWSRRDRAAVAVAPALVAVGALWL